MAEASASLLCPTCGEVVEIDRTLREDSDSVYNYAVVGHEACQDAQFMRFLRRALKTPREKAPRQPRSQSVRNRRNGRDGQRLVARVLDARDIGTLGGVDLDGGWFWGEVKNVHGLPAWFKKGMAQLGAKSDRPTFLFVRNVRAGVQSEVYVIETLSQFLEWNGGAKFGDLISEQRR